MPFVKEKYHIEEETIGVNNRRYRLHRLIEDFGRLIMITKDHLAVKADIDLFNREKHGDGVRNVIDEISCVYKKATFFSDQAKYNIYFASGSGGSCSVDGIQGAPPTYWESYIKPSNTYEDDRRFADDIVGILRKRFPGIQCENNVGERGSFHERFQSFNLEIDVNSLSECALTHGTTAERVMEELFDLIREKVRYCREEETVTKARSAINSAIELDLTGQICSDSIGYRIYSGFGGQVDFIRGAARSKGGKPIIALPSTTRDGTVSKIVPHLKEGAGVVTSRGDVHYVVTEYGVAYLHGKSLRRRAEALISIAHPNFRDELTAFAKKNNVI